MLRFDRVLTAPTRTELERTLSEAAKAANKGCRARTLPWTPANTESLLLHGVGAPEGFRQWNAEGESKKRGFANETRSALAVAWWTDPLQRTHYRIGADRVYCASSHVDQLFCPYRKRSPLWMTHPENVYFRGEKEALTPFAMCRCGAVGTPASLAWMGPHCAACHDRSEEEGAPLIPAGEPARTLLVGHTGWVGPVMFTLDGQSVISGDRCGSRLLVWNLATATARELISDKGQLYALALSPDGETLAAGYGRGDVVLFSLKDGTQRQTFTIGSGNGGDRVLDLAFSPDGSLLAAAPYGRVELWDLATATRRALVVEGLVATWPARFLAFAPDGRTLVVGHGGRRGILLWDLVAGEGRNLEIPGIEHYASSVVFTPNWRSLAVSNRSPGNVRLVDLSSGQVQTQMDFDQANDFAIAPDGRVLAVAGHDDSLRLFSVPDGRTLGVFYWHMNNLNAVAFSPDGCWLVTSSDDSFVKLWPVQTLLAEATRYTHRGVD